MISRVDHTDSSRSISLASRSISFSSGRALLSVCGGGGHSSFGRRNTVIRSLLKNCRHNTPHTTTNHEPLKCECLQAQLRWGSGERRARRHLLSNHLVRRHQPLLLFVEHHFLEGAKRRWWRARRR
jgi:hypothetical protein